VLFKKGNGKASERKKWGSSDGGKRGKAARKVIENGVSSGHMEGERHCWKEREQEEGRSWGRGA